MESDGWYGSKFLSWLPSRLILRHMPRIKNRNAKKIQGVLAKQELGIMTCNYSIMELNYRKMCIVLRTIKPVE